MGSDQLFKQAFADRFASLNSAFSSSPGSEVDFIALSGGPNCSSCQAFTAPARDMHAGWGKPGPSRGGNVLQWLVFFALIVGIVLVLTYIMRQLGKNRSASNKPSTIFGAVHKHGGIMGVGDSSGAAKNAGKSGGAKDVTAAADIMPAADDGDINVIFMHATWCGHCKQMLPDFKAMAQKYGNKANFKMVESEVLKNAKDLTTKLDLKGFPMTCFVRGKEVLDKIVGRVDAATLEAKIKKHTASK